MSFLGSLGELVSNGLPVATNVAAAHQQAAANTVQQQQSALMQRYMLERQQRDDDAKRTLMQAQTNQANSRANVLANPATKYTYKVGADGSLYGLPTSAAAGVDPQQGLKPVSTGVKAPTPAVKPAASIPGTPEYYANQTKVADIRGKAAEKYRAPVQPTLTIVGGPDGSAQGVITRGPGTGTVKALPGVTKAAPGAGNEQNKLTGARARAAIGEMNNADPSMGEFEAKLKAGSADISGLDQYLHAVGDDFIKNESPAKQTAAMAILNRKNPELARYVRRGLSFAEGESQVSSRPSDFRTKMAAFLSTASTGAPSEMIDDIQSRRASILNQLNAAYPDVKANAATGGRSSGSSGSSAASSPDLAHRQQLWDKAVALHGEAKVLQEVGPRPKQ